MFKKCFQCGTCSSTCQLSPETEPFPRKEMAWAAWGLRERLLGDPDVWLCHQCNDCTSLCPRGGRPGDVLAAVRRECVIEYAVPRSLARLVGRPGSIPLLLGIPAAIMCVALLVRDSLGEALGFVETRAGKIAYSTSSMFPQWLLNGLFGIVSLLVLVAIAISVARYWRACKAGTPPERLSPPARGLGASLLATLGKLITHDEFGQCTRARPRLWSHRFVFFGFLALAVVSLYVVTAPFSPLVSSDFAYPLGFWHPWKLLANLGGAALVAGCLLMIYDRLREDREAVSSTYFDWALIGALLLVAITGFVTEILHFVRLEPHRHVAYFVHLVFVLALILYLPYSKLAHLAYRTTALVFAERTGRRAEPAPKGESR